MPEKTRFFLEVLFVRLRQHQFPLGPTDYAELRRALRAGFGWSSSEALRDLCVALWAKSVHEQQILEELFDQLDFQRWQLPDQIQAKHLAESAKEDELDDMWPDDQPPTAQHFSLPTYGPTLQGQSHLPHPFPSPTKLAKHHFIFTPQFPLTYRQVAQAWRRLRRPVRTGPPTELDIAATIAHRSRTGAITKPVLRPRRRNTARLLLLVDRQGSMTPFHHFIEEVCRAILHSGRLEKVGLYFFHDTPVEGADERILNRLAGQLFPTLDSVLTDIQPFLTGYLHADPELLSPQPIVEVLKNYARSAAVVLISDAGAARRRYDMLRLLDTVAFLKGLHDYTSRIVWLNPLRSEYWRGSTAVQIARHVPMFPLDHQGMYRAVNVLRGQPYPVKRPV